MTIFFPISSFFTSVLLRPPMVDGIVREMAIIEILGVITTFVFVVSWWLE